MKINAIARKAIADKLASAIKREGLTKGEASIIFNMKPDRISKFLNPNHRDLIADKYVEKFREWSNTGENLRVWAKKNNPGSSEGVHRPVIDNTSLPPKKESDKGSKQVITAINYDGAKGQIIVHLFEGFDSNKMNVKKLIECLKEFNDGSLLIDYQPNRKDGASLQEIAQLLDEKLCNQSDILLAIAEETESQDRLGIILDAIDEVKEMGFDIDIHINPKQ